MVMEYYLARVDGGFSVSMWLMPTAPGRLMLKRTLDGTFTPFSVSLMLTAGFYQIHIEYAYQTAPMVWILHIVDVLVYICNRC